MKKYLVQPGFVISMKDRGVHYTTCKELMNLYNVNPAECILDMGENSLARLDKKWVATLIKLGPRSDGNYTL